MTLLSVEETLSRCLDLAPKLPLETLPLRAALGRVMVQAPTAQLTQPPFDNAAMDGYALGAPAGPGATFAVLAGEAAAGHGYRGAPLTAGQALRIFTGAPLPAGAVCVVMQEQVQRSGDHITLTEAAAPGAHIRRRGQDFAAGDALPAPRLLRPADLGLLAAMNIDQITTHRRPELAIIATGDELAPLGSTLGPDQIVASAGYSIAALAEAQGAKVRLLPIARDDREALAYVLGLAKGADVIVTIGGASVGDHDLVGQVAADLGLQRDFWRIAMRPGKPLMAGRLWGAAMLGLPGNPVSAFVCALIFLCPMLRAIQGMEAALPYRTAPLGQPLPANGPRTHYMRAQLQGGVITPFANQDSALLSLLAQADALMVHPAGAGPLPAGTPMQYLQL
jgi:molybdopterin molybdotransferase